MKRANVSGGRCKVCGVRVAWALKPTGGWHRPLEQVEDPSLWTVDDAGVVQEVGPIFRTHVCNPETRTAYQEAKDEYAATHVEGSSHTHQDVSVVCPRCNAAVGERCLPLRPEQYKKANKFNGDHLVTPHGERVVLAGGAT